MLVPGALTARTKRRIAMVPTRQRAGLLSVALGFAAALSLACQSTGPAPASDARGDILDTLDTYADATLDEDMATLSEVWVMDPTTRAEVANEFATTEHVSVSIRPQELVIRAGGEQATASFDRVVRTREGDEIRVEAASYEAQLERRDGAWKIVALEALAEDPAALAAADDDEPEVIAIPDTKSTATITAPAAAAAAALGAGEPANAVRNAMDEYRSAYTSRDTERLRSVWDLSRVEAFLMKAAWRRCEPVDLTLDERTLEVEGGEAKVAFDQRMTYRCPGGSTHSVRALEARLEQRPDGSWKIAKLVTRKAPKSLTVWASGSVSAATTVPAIEALHTYQTAIQSCDLDGLSGAWVMSEAERSHVARFCARYGEKLSVSVRQQDVRLDGDRGEVRFLQEVTYEDRGRVRQVMADLRAALVQRKTGEWTMWDLEDAQ
jgi:hypothetical protein